MKHVVIGAGPAGVRAAETLREHDPRASITLVSGEPGPALRAHGDPVHSGWTHRRGRRPAAPGPAALRGASTSAISTPGHCGSAPGRTAASSISTTDRRSSMTVCSWRRDRHRHGRRSPVPTSPASSRAGRSPTRGPLRRQAATRHPDRDGRRRLRRRRVHEVAGRARREADGHRRTLRADPALDDDAGRQPAAAAMAGGARRRGHHEGADRANRTRTAARHQRAHARRRPGDPRNGRAAQRRVPRRHRCARRPGPRGRRPDAHDGASRLRRGRRRTGPRLLDRRVGRPRAAADGHRARTRGRPQHGGRRRALPRQPRHERARHCGPRHRDVRSMAGRTRAARPRRASTKARSTTPACASRATRSSARSASDRAAASVPSAA